MALGYLELYNPSRKLVPTQTAHLKHLGVSTLKPPDLEVDRVREVDRGRKIEQRLGRRMDESASGVGCWGECGRIVEKT